MLRYHTVPLYLIGPVEKHCFFFHNLLTCNKKYRIELYVSKTTVHELGENFFEKKIRVYMLLYFSLKRLFKGHIQITPSARGVFL